MKFVEACVLLGGSRDLVAGSYRLGTQRTQYTLIMEYTLNYKGLIILV